ncbi:N-acetylglucosamine-6-phosphate deacetylase [Octopus vulgaris]|uniref:N-acetylglucosamine-6-phosphate deacetylase n=1 Tax=Octopus vulgaris TaxID=6645 RepID=A0AA36BI06_OCTVU|nr:N-acetylglucosamine-6-phosphate deacetylase [Octopus vulgaris]
MLFRQSQVLVVIRQRALYALNLFTMVQKGTRDCAPYLQFQNCRIIADNDLIREDLWCQDGKIVNPEKVFFDERVIADEQIDCKGAIISAGFIEAQINGAQGIDFSLETENVELGLKKVSKKLLEHGVTSFCPTIVSSTPDKYHQILPHMKKSEGSKEGSGILGVHLEGPFINEEKKGAHLNQCLRTFHNGLQDVLNVYGHLDDAAIITLAPELDNSSHVIKELSQRGITVSLGHSMANLVQGEIAVQHGASFITHLFNAMLPFHHRDPHLVGLLTSEKIPDNRTIYYGLISDGIHTHPAALRIAYRVHPKGLVIVTDAVPAMGLPPGLHTIGPQKVEIKHNRAVLAGTETLCGSIASMDKCVRHFFNSTKCSVVEALEMASLHPAQLLNISDKKGSLDFGSDADFIMLNDNLEIQSTYIASELVWQKS